MDVMIERACGLDVHKKSITACIMTPDGKEIKTFRTHTVFLLDLIDWIKQHRCTHVAMESTDVYWKPIVNLLDAEEGVELNNSLGHYSNKENGFEKYFYGMTQEENYKMSTKAKPDKYNPNSSP